MIRQRLLQIQKEKQEKRKREILEEILNVIVEGKAKRELKNLTIFVTLLAGAILGRIALQAVPSVEPIIPLAVVAGLLYGMKEGFMLGGTAYVVSNFFVWGLQGPWTIFQAIGGAMAGGMAGLIGKTKKPTAKDVIIWSLIGTLFFEFLMNISGSLMGIGMLGLIGLLSLPMYFLTSLPFTLTHTVSNLIFAKMFSPILKLRRQENEFKMVSVSRIASGRVDTVRLYKSRE